MKINFRMKILLINPPVRENEPPRHIPVGLAIIANILLKQGHLVDVLDINAERLSNSDVQQRIDLNSEYDVIGTGGLITTYKYLTWLIPELKKYNPNSKIIVGGGVVTEDPALLLKRVPADVAVVGEGEITVINLISALANNNSLETVKGIAYRAQDNQIKVNPPQPLIEDLSLLPLPAYDLFPIDIYLHNVGHAGYIGKKTEASIITARGCPYNCNYCYHVFGRGARVRSIDNVIEEIKFLIERYNIESLLILDETFTINKKRVAEFCDKMLSEKIDIPWSCYARVNLVDSEMFRKMKQAGCYRVNYGIESGSQKILDGMNKKVTIEQAGNAIKLTRNEGLICGATFMFGYPGENLETIKETVDFCRKLLVRPTLFFTTPYPGTQLYDQTEERIIKKYANKEKFIEQLGDVLEFTVNLTDFSDEDLFSLKDEAAKKMRKIPLRRYPEYFYLLCKQYGLYNIIRYAAKKMRNKLNL